MYLPIRNCDVPVPSLCQTAKTCVIGTIIEDSDGIVYSYLCMYIYIYIILYIPLQ